MYRFEVRVLGAANPFKCHHLGGDQLHASDIPLPPGVTAMLDPETLVAQIVAPRVQEGTGEAVEGAEAGTPAESSGEAAPSEGSAESDS